jgi:hypothetical protein
MNRFELTKRVVPAALIAAGVLALGLTACGGTGPLAQPAPLFGAQARRDYNQQQAARAQAAANQRENTTGQTGSAEREANTLDNDAPLTTRDIQDPNSQLTTPRDSPVPGAPNPLGPNVSTTPPN